MCSKDYDMVFKLLKNRRQTDLDTGKLKNKDRQNQTQEDGEQTKAWKSRQTHLKCKEAYTYGSVAIPL